MKKLWGCQQLYASALQYLILQQVSGAPREVGDRSASAYPVWQSPRDPFHRIAPKVDDAVPDECSEVDDVDRQRLLKCDAVAVYPSPSFAECAVSIACRIFFSFQSPCPAST